MGDQGIEVEFEGAGRHRAESGEDFRAREVELPDLVELLALLAALRSCLGDGAGERAGGEQAVREQAVREQAGGERDGRHAAARASAGSRPWTASTGRHAAERQALRQPVARSAQAVVRPGRHRAPGAEPDPVTAGGGAVGGGLTGGGVMSRWSSVAAVLERAMVHETLVSALVRETPVVPPVRAVRAPGASRRVQDEVAERWTAEQWMPAQRRSEPDAPGIRATRRRSEPDAPAVRPVGWHPVPRPRPATDARPANPPAPEVPERLAG